MAIQIKDGRIGFSCDVCGEFVGNIGLRESCQKCRKDLCFDHARPGHVRMKSPPALRRIRFKLTFLCPACLDEIEREEQEEQQEKEELEKEREQRPVTHCKLCSADDSPPDQKIFGYRPPTFTNCERCGRLVCDQCLLDVYDPYYDYGLVCKECYQAKEQQDAKEREEYWLEEEENKIEE